MYLQKITVPRVPAYPCPPQHGCAGAEVPLHQQENQVGPTAAHGRRAVRNNRTHRIHHRENTQQQRHRPAATATTQGGETRVISTG